MPTFNPPHTNALTNAQLIADLEWAISSPPLLRPKAPVPNTQEPSLADAQNSVIYPSSKWFNEQHSQASTWLTQLKKDPAPLQAHHEQQKDHRLGAYFESLIAFWLINHPQLELLEQRLQINDQNRTIGEFDFIVFDKQRKKTMHWEVASKFYLQSHPDAQEAHWVGATQNDHWHKKYEHLNQQQLQLARAEASLPILEKKDISIDEVWCIIKGRLFYHPQWKNKAKHHTFSENHHKGWWLSQKNFLNTYKDSNAQWLILNKPFWFSGNHSPTKFISTQQAGVLDSTNHPVQLAEIVQSENGTYREVSRGFMVDNDWLNRIK